MKQNTSRRSFIAQSCKAGAALAISSTAVSSLVSCNVAKPLGNVPKVGFTQDPLPYGYRALEPMIDAQTMEIHYTKHAAAYAKNLSEAISAEGVSTATTTLEELLGNISKYSNKMRNNAGGHYNHELFWKMMSPKADDKPSYVLSNAIMRDFGSYDAFLNQFNDAAKGRFGSGWAWLVLGNDRKLKVGSTANQDNPLMNISELKGMPLLGLDVWEHAYYLKYQNRRADYINNWWKVVNWNFVSERYDAALKS